MSSFPYKKPHKKPLQPKPGILQQSSSFLLGEKYSRTTSIPVRK